MRTSKFKVIIMLAALALAGCQAVVYGTASEFEKLSIGMTKDQVVELLGKPTSIGADGEKSEEYLIYKRMKHAISAWPRTYQVTLRNGKVIKYGEQYDEKNINVF
jgi:hypothetical protein